MSLSAIKRKLNQLCKLDKDVNVNPTISEEDVAAFEEKNGIKLPKDYREYLINVGNGGSGGPFFGLFKLGEGDGWEPDFSKPFPLSCGQRLVLAEVYDDIDFKVREACPKNEDEEYDLREKHYAKVCETVGGGFVFLCTEGCGMNSILIVNGEAFGTVWYYDMANEAGIFPLTDPETNESMTFERWYEIWLDCSIDCLKNGTGLSFDTYADFIVKPEYFEPDADDELCMIAQLQNLKTSESVTFFGNLSRQSILVFKPKNLLITMASSFDVLDCFSDMEEKSDENNCEYRILKQGYLPPVFTEKYFNDCKIIPENTNLFSLFDGYNCEITDILNEFK